MVVVTPLTPVQLTLLIIPRQENAHAIMDIALIPVRQVVCTSEQPLQHLHVHKTLIATGQLARAITGIWQVEEVASHTIKVAKISMAIIAMEIAPLVIAPLDINGTRQERHA